MGIVTDLIDKQGHLERERSNFEHHWAEVARVVFPRQDEFFGDHTQGERRTKGRYDDTATLALDRGAAAIESVVSPRGTLWHGIGLPEEIEDDYESQVWTDKLTQFLFKRRYDARSNFASNLHECYMSLLAFGNCVMILEDMLNGMIRYKSSHIAEHFYIENSFGRIDTNYRKYNLTARAASQKFGDATPQKILDALEREPAKKFKFLHVVMPDDDNETDGKFISYHVSVDTNELLSVGSFSSFPYIISRWTTSPNEIYGRSPAMTVLAEIKMLNAMRKTDIKARHMAVDPPILAASQSTIRRFSMKPSAINYGTLDAAGNPLVKPYNSGVNINASNDGIDQSRAFINEAFFLNLFQILVDSPQQTATEVLQKAQEKGQLLTPSAGRQMSELLEPMIMREVDIYQKYGVFEDDGLLALPDAVKEMGGEFNIKYTNPLSQMQLSQEALGAERTLQSLIPAAQFDPTVLERFDFGEYAEIMRKANGAPTRILRSPEEMQEREAAKAEAAALQQVVEAAPQVADATKKIAEAQSIQSGG